MIIIIMIIIIIVIIIIIIIIIYIYIYIYIMYNYYNYGGLLLEAEHRGFQLLHPDVQAPEARGARRPPALRRLSQASRRGQDKRGFYRSAINSQSNAIITP